MSISKQEYYRFDRIKLNDEIKIIEDVNGTLIKFKGEVTHHLIDQLKIQGIQITENWFDDFKFFNSRTVPTLGVKCMDVEFWGRGTNHGKFYGVYVVNPGSYSPFTKRENEEGVHLCNKDFYEIRFVHELQQWWRNNAEGELIIKDKLL